MSTSLQIWSYLLCKNKTEQKAKVSRNYLAFSMVFTGEDGAVSDVASIFQLTARKQFG